MLSYLHPNSFFVKELTPISVIGITDLRSLGLSKNQELQRPQYLEGHDVNFKNVSVVEGPKG